MVLAGATTESNMYTLTVKMGKELPGLTIDLGDGDHTVGRSKECHILIPDGSVSRHHCLLLVHGAEVIVRDCGSHNGTFVDGVRINGQRPLKSGQVLRFGQIEAQVAFHPESMAPLDDDSCESAVGDLRRWEKFKATIPIPRLAGVVAGGVEQCEETISQRPGCVDTGEQECERAHTPSRSSSTAKSGTDLFTWLWLVNGVFVVLIALFLFWLCRSG